MQRSRLFFIEPSKVRTQHITLISGYLDALLTSVAIGRSHEVVLCAAPSTRASLPAAIREKLPHRAIPVMDPEKRRLPIKGLLEFLVVLRYVAAMRRGDVVFVACLMSPALLLLEMVNRVLRRNGVFVVLHGDLEGLFDPELQGVSSFGYWMLQWIKRRRPDSLVNVVVIDDFIKAKLLEEFPDKLDATKVFVAYHPVTEGEVTDRADDGKPSACFIGYRSAAKGFDVFEELSRRVPDVRFLAIGGGQVEDLGTGTKTRLTGNSDYMQAIGSCVVAVYPYKKSYTCSLSAAALDALSIGVHLAATPRPCFVSLKEHFGDDTVSLCATPDELAALLSDRAALEKRRANQHQRKQALAVSKYSIAGVRACFETLVAAVAPPVRNAA